MFGLLKKQINLVDVSIAEQAYDTDRERLIALLQTDLRLITQEKSQIQNAITALKAAKGKLAREHRDVINSRLALVHANILSADKEVRDQSAHVPAEATTLNDLEAKASEIFERMRELKQIAAVKK